MADPQEIRKLIDEHFSLAWCRENVVIPMEVADSASPSEPGVRTMIIAVGDLSYLGTIGGFIKHRVSRTGLNCQFVEKSPETIQALLDQAAAEQHFSEGDLDQSVYDVEALIEVLGEAGEGDMGAISFEFEDEDELSIADEEIADISAELLGTPLQRAAAQILIKAIRDNVSTIHIEPHEFEFSVRLRQDGVLLPFIRIPSSVGIKLTAVLKTMAGMNVTERRASQEGRILRKLEGNKIEFRVGTLPSKYGEKTVLRVLQSSAEMLNLDMLISNVDVLARLRSLIHQTSGIIIVAGPTGSGKSTTLFSAISELNAGENNIVTVEDHIEYTLPGITQVQVQRDSNQAFAPILRTFLRWDPDVILVSELWGAEDCSVAFDAAVSGTLVLASLHAKNTLDALSRLAAMRIESHKIIALNGGVLAQRLMRRICTECSVSRPIADGEVDLTRLIVGTPVRHANYLTAEEKEVRMREGSLCNRCHGSGYWGRVGVFEILPFSAEVTTALINFSKDSSLQNLYALLEKEAILGPTMLDYGRALVRDGITSVSELERLRLSL